MRRQLNELLAREKEHAVDLRKAIDDKDSLSDRLEAASYRYMMAEKKLDRAKSAQVQKLERAAMMGGNGEASSPTTSRRPAEGQDQPEVVEVLPVPVPLARHVVFEDAQDALPKPQQGFRLG